GPGVSFPRCDSAWRHCRQSLGMVPSGACGLDAQNRRHIDCVQFGVLRPQFADPRLSDLPAPAGSSVEGTPGFGERSSQPFYQARVAVSHPMNDSNIAVGAAGHYGRERIGTDRTIESWAFAADYAVPVHRRVIWRGEAFAGSNLVPFQGGVLQG